MKLIQIEFVENQRWRWVWAMALAAILVIMSVCIWHGWQLDTAVTEESNHIATLQVQLEQHLRPVLHPVDVRLDSAERAVQLLQQDLNRGFASAENLQEPGARLRAITLDNISGVLRLEYDLDSVIKASSVTEALNAGYESQPWHLEGVSATVDSSIGHGTVVSMPLASVFRGVWSVRLKYL